MATITYCAYIDCNSLILRQDVKASLWFFFETSVLIMRWTLLLTLGLLCISPCKKTTSLCFNRCNVFLKTVNVKISSFEFPLILKCLVLSLSNNVNVLDFNNTLKPLMQHCGYGTEVPVSNWLKKQKKQLVAPCPKPAAYMSNNLKNDLFFLNFPKEQRTVKEEMCGFSPSTERMKTTQPGNREHPWQRRNHMFISDVTR